MTTAIETFFDDLIKEWGSDRVTRDPSVWAPLLTNTLGVHRTLTGVVYPESAEDVCQVVKMARQHKVPLYPISCGQNVGYGQRLPVRDGSVLVDLGRMNKIKEFDSIQGSVVVEPGVTQGQLYQFLEDQKAKFWLDATGAGLRASIIGNSLEGGFGHTPKGDHRRFWTDVALVLGNGQVLKTGTFPGLGPDLAGLFVQSNFGIITSARVELMPKPERFVSFIVSVKGDEQLGSLVDAMRQLRQAGHLQSLVHIANALRSLMTCLPFPGTYKNSLIKNEDAKRLMSVPFLPVGLWTAAGGIYGNQAQVRAAKMAIRKQVAGFGRVNFFSDLTLSLLLHLSAAPLIKITRFGKRANESLKAFQPIHQLMQGVPSPEAMDNIGWRHAEPDKMGLLWCAPTISSEGNKAREAIQLAEKIFYEHGFEMPATLTLVRPERLVCVLSIHFDKSDPAERERAHTLYHTLNHRFAEMGIYPYRTSILTMEKMQYEGGKQEVLAALKKIFDPDGLISPGRYGMG